jgi:GH24 family phage-related lysozyme (muramidase)
MQYDVSPFTLDFIKGLEGYTPKPKWDYKQWSSGYGTRWEPGQPMGTRADHEAALASEAGKVSSWLDQNVKVPLDANKRAALTSAGFNLGTGKDGIGRLLGDINAGNWDSIARRLPTFNKAGGEVNEGLVNRRAKEVALLLGQNSADASMNQNPYADPNNPHSAGFRRPAPIGSTVAGGTPAGGGQPMPMEALQAPSGQYSKLAQALLASAAGAKPRGWGDLLNATGDLALGYSLSNKDERRQNEYQSKLAQMLGGASPDQIPDAMINSGDPAMMQQGVQAKMQAAAAQAKANAPLRGKDKFMSTPSGVFDVETMQVIPGTEKSAGGKAFKVGDAIVQQGPDGKWAAVYQGQGATPASGLDPVAEKERQKAIGKARGEAEAAQPRAVEQGAGMLQVIDSILDDPYLPSMTGSMQGRMPNTTEDAVRVQSKFDQLQGQVFMKAYQELKGGGAISDFEANKAEQAFARISDPRMSDADYKKALQDLRSVIAAGVEKAGGAVTAPAPAQPAAAPPPQALEMLQSDPSPEAMQEFDEIFGPGAAQRALGR